MALLAVTIFAAAACDIVARVFVAPRRVALAVQRVRAARDTIARAQEDEGMVWVLHDDLRAAARELTEAQQWLLWA